MCREVELTQTMLAFWKVVRSHAGMKMNSGLDGTAVMAELQVFRWMIQMETIIATDPKGKMIIEDLDVPDNNDVEELEDT